MQEMYKVITDRGQYEAFAADYAQLKIPNPHNGQRQAKPDANRRGGLVA